MAELTVSGLRNKLKRDIDLARERVRTLEEQLKWLDGAITECPDREEDGIQQRDSEDSGEDQLSLLAPTASSEGNTVGTTARELMENAPGQFNVPGIVKAIVPSFPAADRSELSKRASQVANRLRKKGKIKIVKKGSGREPNTYISAKYS